MSNDEAQEGQSMTPSFTGAVKLLEQMACCRPQSMATPMRTEHGIGSTPGLRGNPKAGQQLSHGPGHHRLQQHATHTQ
jgi:hypothetical protein